jgi:hypothetical protein
LYSLALLFVNQRIAIQTVSMDRMSAVKPGQAEWSSERRSWGGLPAIDGEAELTRKE